MVVEPAVVSEPSIVFVSHASRDRLWAGWVASRLRGAGFQVELDNTDWVPGQNFVERMSRALDRAQLIVALWSNAYFSPSCYALRELEAAVAANKRVVPLRIDDVTPPAFWRPLIHRDLFGLERHLAEQVLIEAVGPPGILVSPTDFPGDETSRPPEPPVPRLWNVPARSTVFTGRRDMLDKLRDSLRSDGNPTVVYALQGIGGVGKTLLAVEYAHRFAGDYELVWWINAERPELVDEQLAGLAIAAGAARPGVAIPVAATAARVLLRGDHRWLIVMDNASSAADIARLLPQGQGHLIITSRSRAWTGVAATLPVDVFTRSESVALLCAQEPRISEADADRLASRLGDLPLALAQAAGVMSETGMSVGEYVKSLGTTAAVLEEGVPAAYPKSLAATIRIAVGRLGEVDPAAVQLAQVLCMLGPDPVSLWILQAAAQEFPEPMAEAANDALALRRCLGWMARFGLAQADTESIRMHRLTQAVIRDDLGPQGGRLERSRVESILLAARPDDASDPSSWPRWGQLLPHVLATDPESTTNDQFRRLACDTVWCQYARGEARAARPVAERLHGAWRRRYGVDDQYVLLSAHILAVVYQALGRYEISRLLNQETFDRCRRLFGEDHPSTLASANSLGADFRELENKEDARQLHVDTRDRRRRLLGPDHPDTLVSDSSLAIDLLALGRVEEARELEKDTLDRRRRVLGPDHPDTLISASGLAADLLALGQVEQARELEEDTFDRRRRVLGRDHPDTFVSASGLAAALRALGQVERARELEEDTLSRRWRVLGPDHPDISPSSNNLPDVDKQWRYGQLWRHGWEMPPEPPDEAKPAKAKPG